MAAPRFDEIQGEEIPPVSRPAAVPRFDEIEGTDVAPDMGADHAATLGFANGGTFGFVDEIGGAIGKALGVSDPGVKLGAAAMPSASDTPEERAAKEALQQGVHEYKDSYTDVRDRIRNEAKQAREQHAAAFTAGDIAGGVAANVVGGMLAPGVAAPLVEGMSGAVTQGALSGVGQSEADSLGGMYRDAALGGALGAAGQWVGQKAGQKLANSRVGQWVQHKLSDVPEGIQNFANERALKAAGAIQKDFPKQPGPRARFLEKGRLLLDEPGLITPGASAATIGERATESAQEYGGDVIGRLLKQADDAGAQFDPSSFIARGREVYKEVAGDPALRPQAARIYALLKGYERKAAQYAEEGVPFTFQEANRLKGTLQAAIFNQRGDVKTNYDLANRLQQAFTQSIDEQLEGGLGSTSGALFKDAKLRYGAMATAKELAPQGANRAAGNNMLGLPDMLAANAAAAAGGGPIAAAATGAASRALRGRADSVAAVAAHKLANSDFVQALAKSNPQALGKYGGMVGQAIARGEFPAFHWVMQQRDPEYRATIEAARKGDTE